MGDILWSEEELELNSDVWNQDGNFSTTPNDITDLSEDIVVEDEYIFNMTERDLNQDDDNVCGLESDSLINPYTIWKTIGNVKEIEEEPWKVCDQKKTYRVAIPLAMNFKEALSMCSKLKRQDL